MLRAVLPICLGLAATFSPVVAQTIASGSNQTFGAGQLPTAISPITVTDAATATIKKAKEIRIRIPATLNMTWNTALTTATITGTAASKVSTTVTYEDGGKTLVVNVTNDFGGGNQIVVSGLQYMSFTTASGPASLQLVVAGLGGATAATDSRTIQILAPTIVSAATQVFVVAQAPTAIAAITVTETAVPTITAANDLRIRIPATVNLTWNPALTLATITGTGAIKVSPIVSYADGGKTLVLDVIADFAATDQIVVSGLEYMGFTAPSAADYLQLVVGGSGGGTDASDSRTIQIVAPALASAATQTFVVAQGPTAISAITVTDAGVPTITAANDLRIRIPGTFNMTWNSALTTATITGSGAGKVSPTVSYEDGGKTLVLDVTADLAASDQIVLSGLQYMSFTAPSASDNLELVVFGSGGATTATDSRPIQIVVPAMASAANQVFAVGQGPTGVSPITVTDAATPAITAASDIRIRIPASFNMSWNTALTTATLTGTAAGKVSSTVSYEDGGKTLVLDVTTNFAGNDQIVVSALQYTTFTAPSASDYLQLVVTGAGGAANASDSRTIQIVTPPTIVSAANQVFVVGQAPTGVSPITVTDDATPTITAANDIRIRIPATFDMTWNTALTTATLSGSGAGKVSPTVSYADGGKTLVLNVISDFAGSDQIVASGLQYQSFTAPSAPDYLQLVVFGPGGSTVASDGRTLQIVQPTLASAANQVFAAGQVPTAISPITVTDAATPSITVTQDIRIRIPASFNMSWNTALTTATLTGGAAGKVSPTVSYEDGGKTLVLDVTSDFAGGDPIVVSGLEYQGFTASSAADRLQLVVAGPGAGTNASDSRTIQVVQPTIASAANQVFVVGQVATGMSAITITDGAAPSISTANDIRLRIPATFNMTWNTVLTTATLTGAAAGKVSPTVSYEDGGKTLVLNVTSAFAGSDEIVVSGLQYMGFTAPSAADRLELVVAGPGGATAARDSRTVQIVAPTIASAADQLFLVGQATTAMAAITVTDATTPTITSASDLRIRIPASFNMTWNTALTTATIGGTGAAKVSTTVSYADGGKTLVLNVTANFLANDQIVVSGLEYMSFAAPSPADRLQLVVAGTGGATSATDGRTIRISMPPTMASAANQVFVVAQAPTAMSPITVADAATPTITAAQDIRVRIPATFNMSWNTALTTATLTGTGAGKVSPTVSYEDGGRTLVLNVTTNFAAGDQVVVSALQYTGFTAPSVADYLQLVIFGPAASTAASDSRTIQIVQPTIASAANQVFVVGQAAAGVSPITVTDAATPTITAAQDLRIRIPASFNMTWNTALTTATLTGGAASKVSPTVSYADGGKTLVLNVTANFAGSDQIVVSGLQYTSFTAASAPDYLQLVVSGAGGGTAARDSRTIQIVAPTIASAANQVFVVAQAPTAIAAITVTDAAMATITAAQDIRIRVPASFNMTWNTALTTATLTGGAASKVSTTVSYEDGGKTLVLNVTSNFTAGQQIVVSGLQYQNFTAPSAADSLQLLVAGAGGATAARDSRTIQIAQPAIASAANQLFLVGQTATAMSTITVTDAAAPTITAANDIRIRIPASVSMSWNTGVVTAQITGSGNGKVSKTVSYADGGKTLVLDVTANFTANDRIVVSGLEYTSFTAPSAPDYLQLVVTGAAGATNASDSRTIQIVAPTIAAAANQVFVVGQAPTGVSAITITDAAIATVTAANDLRIRIPATVNMTWNTTLTTATLTGTGAGKVAPTVTYEDGGKTLVLNVTTNFLANDQVVVSGLQYTSFTAPSAADYLQLVVLGAGGGTAASDSRTIQVVQPTLASTANQVFVVGQAPSAISAITVTDAATPSITAGSDIRVRIPASFNMSWNTALTTATLTGTAAGKVAPAVSYEDGGKTLVLNVTTDFAGNDQIVVSGLQYASFTAPSPAAYLQLVVAGAGGGTAASDSRTIQIAAPTLASAANQLFLVGQAATAMSPITITDAGVPTIGAAQDIRVRIPATLNMTWNTALTTATLTGTGASKVSTTVSYEDGGKTLVLNVTSDFAATNQLVVSGLQYKGFTAPSAAEYLQLVVTGAGGATTASDSRTVQIVQPTLASAANQVFVVGQAATPIAAITVTDAAAPSITALSDIRIRIPASFNMTWNMRSPPPRSRGPARARSRPR